MGRDTGGQTEKEIKTGEGGGIEGGVLSINRQMTAK